MDRINRNILLNYPASAAIVSGAPEYPALRGTVNFFEAPGGCVVLTELFGLPSDKGVYAMHIHSGAVCSGNSEDPFAKTGSHLDLTMEEHPYHTGDLPSVFSNGSYSWSAVYTNRFTPKVVEGHTVVIHSMPDDYRTQPSGNAGQKIACGEIMKV